MMLENRNQPAAQPIPELKPLERLVGTWKVSDPTGAGAISGETTFEWINGGSFMLQMRNFAGNSGIEIIGYDQESGTLKSYAFSEDGQVREYEYELDDDTLIISIDTPQEQGDFVATFSEDGNSYTGSWEWDEDGVPMGYDAMMTRVS